MRCVIVGERGGLVSPSAPVFADAQVGRQAGAAFEDFGAIAVAILGSAGAVAGVRALFGVIKTVVEQAYQTRRERQAQDHELRKLVLILGHKRNEIDLDQRAEQIEARIAQLEREALKAIS